MLKNIHKPKTDCICLESTLSILLDSRSSSVSPIQQTTFKPAFNAYSTLSATSYEESCYFGERKKLQQCEGADINKSNIFLTLRSTEIPFADLIRLFKYVSPFRMAKNNPMAIYILNHIRTEKANTRIRMGGDTYFREYLQINN